MRPHPSISIQLARGAARALGLVMTVAALGRVSPVLAQQAAAAAAPPSEAPRAALLVVTPAGSERFRLDARESGAVIDTTRVVVRAGDNAKALLRRYGFRPDANALAWLYARNPDVWHLDSLQVGDSLLMPLLADSSAVAGYLSGEARLALVMEPERKDSLRVVTSTLRMLRDSIRSLGDPGDESLDRASASLDSVIETLATVSFTSAAVTEAVLLELQDRALASISVARELVAEAAATPDLVTVRSDALSTESDDVRRLGKCLRGGGICQVTVTVEPISHPGARPVDDVQLFWAAQGDRLQSWCAGNAAPICRRAFRRNARPYQNEFIISGKFLVWAERRNTVVACDLLIVPTLEGPKDWTLTIPQADPLQCPR